MDGIVRLLMRIIIRKRFLKFTKNAHSIILFFLFSLLITLATAYTIYYNLQDFNSLTNVRIFGLIIIVPIFILFLMSTYLLGFDCLNRYVLKKPITFDYKFYEDDLFDNSYYIGETIIDNIKFEVYKIKEMYYLYNFKKIKGLRVNFKVHKLEVSKKDLTDVYKIVKYCNYKDYKFEKFYISKDKKTVNLITDDFNLGFDKNLDFIRTDKFMFEKQVSIDDVKIEEKRVAVDLTLIN